MNNKCDFQILSVSNNSYVYLDSAATSLTPRCVTDKVGEYYNCYNANIHRGIHDWAEQATGEYEGVRPIVRKFIGANQDKEIVFTSGTTHGINIIANCFCADWTSKDTVILSEAEHHANIVPWQQLKTRQGLTIEVISLLPDGHLDFNQLSAVIQQVKGRCLVSMSVLPNATGIMLDYRRVSEMARDHDATVLFDGAQSVPRVKFDVSYCDFLVFSGHKIYGPTGVGILYARDGFLDEMPPYMGGGDMIKSVRFDRTVYNDMPWRYEAGTTNIAGVIGLGAALDWVKDIDIEKIYQHEKEISDYTQKQLNRIDRVSVLYPDAEKLGLVVFTVNEAQSIDVATLLNTQGIAVRSGYLCAEPVLVNQVGRSVLRASFGVYTTQDDIDRFVDALNKVMTIL